MKDKDLEFLKKLDKKVHFTFKTIMTPNISGGPIECIVNDYTEKSIYKKEMERVLRIIKENNDVILYPINTGCGFLVGFQISKIDGGYPGTEKLESILTFVESQLPKGYNFQDLSEYFMEENNLRLAEQFLNVKIRNDRDFYDY